MAGQRARMPAHRALRALPARRPERYCGEAGQQPACTGNPFRGRWPPRLPEPASGASLFRKLDTVAVPTARLLPAPGSTSAISRRFPAATSAPDCRRCSARWSRVGTRARTGRLDQAARPSGGPPDPARPPRRRSPAQARSQEHSSAPPAS